MTKTNKILINKENGIKFYIYEDNRGMGVKTSEFLGVTSGQSLIYLFQINMEYFEVIG